MSQHNSFGSEPGMLLRAQFRMSKWWLSASALLIAFAVVGSISHAVATNETAIHGRVNGAGKTIIEGGTGGTLPVPVTTLLAFHADAQGGDFECLALAPSQETGSNSGEFDANVMYVTGKVTSLQIGKGVAILMGTANVTGLGAAQATAFTATIHEGGPGTTIKLEVSGLTFSEILVEGHIGID